MNEMHGPDSALPLWIAAIGLAAFICGFGSDGRRNSDFHAVALTIGLAGAFFFAAGIAAVAPVTPPGV